MPGIRVPDGAGSIELVYVLLYRLRTLSEEEKRTWFNEWAEIKANLPHGLNIIVEGFGAFGTSYTGFTVYEGTIEAFRKHFETLEQKSAHFVEKTETIIGTKGFNLPLTGIDEIMKHRPVD
ncbi:MAG: hypothetical protein K9W43_07290 [Candidatus Thorarchaeota archaeon]|nr:hypothetical protein [Candidatus Thorarchaeota archaeon]